MQVFTGDSRTDNTKCIREIAQFSIISTLSGKFAKRGKSGHASKWFPAKIGSNKTESGNF